MQTSTTLPTRTIGGRSVSAIGLGAMPMSIEGRPSAEQSIATIHAALDAGVTLIDTADAYHRDADEVGHNEELIARALREYGPGADDVLVATKGGHLRPGDGSWTKDGRPEYLKEAAKASAQRLGVEAIGLYQFHRPDPDVPYEDSLGAIRDLLDEGVIALAGISNANIEQIETANEILGGRLASVQNQFSPRFRSSEAELRHCAEQGIAFLPWSPLGGIANAGELAANHAAFGEVAAELGVSVYQVTLAWELALAPVVVPIPGASRAASVQDSVLAANLTLTDRQITRLSAA
ncbi:aldo/keto reductase [Zhihengliuella halotolerans]|uniref:Aryl-alcohol dehydrogenase-like predicted oxidoreductase n=1 Tax=Zhihengliuella halotolerans TaxID=370736 RepID=A0A4Q8AEM8_9MICC|nr:aldo/keto reductase [Zhihengliuella halotolerans]RZU62732.1 aryl-alcohol dehydrogenase-like predicted oxidoreductase [Zhihengliuella halotolerans]